MYILKIEKTNCSSCCDIHDEQIIFNELLFEGFREDQIGGSFLLGGLTTDSERIVKELFWRKISIDCSISGNSTSEKLKHAFFKFEDVPFPYEVRLVVNLID